MADDVLLNKAAIIERCVARAREEYEADPSTFATNFTRQDAAILNLQRACEAAIDMGQRIIRQEGLGLTRSARDVFDLLAAAAWIGDSLANTLKMMVGFRNIAVHQYQELQLPILVSIIREDADDLLAFSRQILLRAGKSSEETDDT